MIARTIAFLFNFVLKDVSLFSQMMLVGSGASVIASGSFRIRCFVEIICSFQLVFPLS